jgi:hypothetical protein
MGIDTDRVAAHTRRAAAAKHGLDHRPVVSWMEPRFVVNLTRVSLAVERVWKPREGRLVVVLDDRRNATIEQLMQHRWFADSVETTGGSSALDDHRLLSTCKRILTHDLTLKHARASHLLREFRSLCRRCTRSPRSASPPQ